MRIGWDDSDVLQQSQCGDKLVFKYIVGGGGGHHLYISDAKIRLYCPVKGAKSARSVVR